MQLSDLIKFIENLYPPQFQESYDNSGLIIGNKYEKIKGILLTIDIDQHVVQEAIDKKCNVIISHHPIIFKAIKTLTGKNYIEKTIIKAIKNDIAIYAAHTSLDNSYNGLNKYILSLLGVKKFDIIAPKTQNLNKIITFVPKTHAEKVKQSLFSVGAGYIGNYSNCSYSSSGIGSFKAEKNTTPYVGKHGEIHYENEEKIETIFPSYKRIAIENALKSSHPYEEPAYDIYPLLNYHNKFGAGLIGELEKPIDEKKILGKIKKLLNLKQLKHSDLLTRPIKKIAVCTGAGGFLTETAIAKKADIYISSEFKYNQYIEVRNRLLIVDAGHYETEIFIKNIFYDLLTKNFSTFAVEICENFSNPVNYL